MAIHDGLLVIEQPRSAVARGNTVLHEPNIRIYGVCQEQDLRRRVFGV